MPRRLCVWTFSQTTPLSMSSSSTVGHYDDDDDDDNNNTEWLGVVPMVLAVVRRGDEAQMRRPPGWKENTVRQPKGALFLLANEQKTACSVVGVLSFHSSFLEGVKQVGNWTRQNRSAMEILEIVTAHQKVDGRGRDNEDRKMSWLRL